MTLAPAARLGPFEIQSAIGAGGMGEVYKARDTRLYRDTRLARDETPPPVPACSLMNAVDRTAQPV